MQSPSSDADRRGSPRQAVIYRLDVLTPEGVAGCVLDLSQSGMRVRFRGDLDLAATQRLEVLFPRWLELGRGVELRGRFVWMRASHGGALEAGFAFDELSRKEEGLIQVLIQRLTDALAEDRPAAVLA